MVRHHQEIGRRRAVIRLYDVCDWRTHGRVYPVAENLG